MIRVSMAYAHYFEVRMQSSWWFCYTRLSSTLCLIATSYTCFTCVLRFVAWRINFAMGLRLTVTTCLWSACEHDGRQCSLFQQSVNICIDLTLVIVIACYLMTPSIVIIQNFKLPATLKHQLLWSILTLPWAIFTAPCKLQMHSNIPICKPIGCTNFAHEPRAHIQLLTVHVNSLFTCTHQQNFHTTWQDIHAVRNAFRNKVWTFCWNVTCTCQVQATV